MLARIAGWGVLPQRLDQLDRFLQLGNTHRRLGIFVIVSRIFFVHPARAQAKDKATPREPLQIGDHFGQHAWRTVRLAGDTAGKIQRGIARGKPGNRRKTFNVRGILGLPFSPRPEVIIYPHRVEILLRLIKRLADLRVEGLAVAPIHGEGGHMPAEFYLCHAVLPYDN